MEKNLPARPNLDHLRRQAKALLSALESRETEAVSTVLKRLPAGKDMTAEQVLGTHFRLADAQSAIARKNGFASWPHLTRHVEQLRALEGSWAFACLEIDGSAIPASATATIITMTENGCRKASRTSFMLGLTLPALIYH